MLVQTFTPEHPCIALAATHDYAGFVAGELAHRRAHNYPPYQRLARLIVRSRDQEAAADFAERLAAAFHDGAADAGRRGRRRGAPAGAGRGAGVPAQGLLPLPLPAAVAEPGDAAPGAARPCCRRCGRRPASSSRWTWIRSTCCERRRTGRRAGTRPNPSRSHSPALDPPCLAPYYPPPGRTHGGAGQGGWAMRVFAGDEVEEVKVAVGAKPGCSAPLLVPARPEDLAPHYDLTISHPALDAPQFAAFDRWLVRRRPDFGLSCALIHDGVVAEAVRRLGDGRLTIGYHLDYFALWHVADDPYARLAEAVQDAGGRSVNPPARRAPSPTRRRPTPSWCAAAWARRRPSSCRPWAADRPLTAAERAPAAAGRAGRPRLRQAGQRLLRPRRRARGPHRRRTAWPPPSPPRGATTAATAYLVQREVRPPRLTCDDGGERPAYWRVHRLSGRVDCPSGGGRRRAWATAGRATSR